MAYPWQVRVESLDSFVIIYSMAVVCYAMLFYTINARCQRSFSELATSDSTEEQLGEEIVQADTIVSSKMANEELLLYDSVYWGLNFTVVFLVADITAPISVPSGIAWSCVGYVVAMYIVCQPCKIGPVPQTVLLLFFLLHMVCITVACNASILNGLSLLVVHMCNVIFIYIHIAEGCVTYIKYINARFWGVVALNICITFTYCSNISIFSPMYQAQYVA